MKKRKIRTKKKVAIKTTFINKKELEKYTLIKNKL